MNCHTLQRHTIWLTSGFNVEPLQFQRGGPDVLSEIPDLVRTNTAGVVHLFAQPEVKQPQKCWGVDVV